MANTDAGPIDHVIKADHFAAPPRETASSHFIAFLMCGVIIAGGMLAVMYYDTTVPDHRYDEPLTTGSLSLSHQTSAGSPNVRVRIESPDASGK